MNLQKKILIRTKMKTNTQKMVAIVNKFGTSSEKKK